MERKKFKKLIYLVCSILAAQEISNQNKLMAAGNIISDYNATKKPDILKTKSGVDQIDIVAPDSKGRSHNMFEKFNVEETGVIFNNSRNLVITELGGLITGNPNLLTTALADMIIAEVTSGNKSDINGFIEIAGQKADFILANPNGIYIGGTKFINVNNTTIMTGKIGGNISDNALIIGEYGLESSGNLNLITNKLTSSANIISKKDVNILTGIESYDLDTGEFIVKKNPNIAGNIVDIADKSGIYAPGKIYMLNNADNNNIKIVGSVDSRNGSIEINSASTVEANKLRAYDEINIYSKGDVIQKSNVNDGAFIADNIILNSEKDVMLSDMIKGYMSVNIGANNLILNSADIYAGVTGEDNSNVKININTANDMSLRGDSNIISLNNIDIKNGRNFLNEGQIFGENSVNIEASKLKNINLIEGDKSLNIKVTNNIDNMGSMYSKRDVNLYSNTLTNQGTISSVESATIITESNLKNEKTIASEKLLDIKVGTNLINYDYIGSNDILNIKARNLENEKTVYSKTLNMNIDENVNNLGDIYSSETGNLFIGDLLNNTGSIVSNSILTITAKDINNKLTIGSNKNTSLMSTFLNNTGDITATENLSINAKNTLNSGSIYSSKLALDSTEDLYNTGEIVANEATINSKKITNISKETLPNELETIARISGSNKLEINSEILMNSAYILGSKDIDIRSNEIKNQNGGNIQSVDSKDQNGNIIEEEQNVNIVSNNLENNGVIYSGDNLSLKNTNTIKNTKIITGEKKNTIETNKVVNTGSITSLSDKIEADGSSTTMGELEITAVTIENKDKGSIAGKDVIINGTGESKLINDGKIQAINSIKIGIDNIENTNVIVGDTVNITSKDISNKNFGVKDTEDYRSGTIYGEKSNLVKAVNKLVNEGVIASDTTNGTLKIDLGKTGNIQNEGVMYGKVVEILAKEIENSGTILTQVADGNMKITSEKLVNKKINDEQSGSIVVQGQGYINISDTLENEGTIYIKENSELDMIVKILKNTGVIVGIKDSVINTSGESFENTGVVDAYSLNMTNDVIRNVETGTDPEKITAYIKGKNIDIKNKEVHNDAAIIYSENLNIDSEVIKNSKDIVYMAEAIAVDPLNPMPPVEPSSTNSKLSIKVSETLENSGTIYADNKSINESTIKSEKGIENTGFISLGKNGSIKANTDIKNSGTLYVTNEGKLLIKANNLINTETGVIYGESERGEDTVDADGNEVRGTLTKNSEIKIEGRNLENNGLINAGNLLINLDELFTNKGKVYGEDLIDITANNLINTKGDDYFIYSNNGLNLKLSTENFRKIGTIYSKGYFDIYNTGTITIEDMLQTLGDLKMVSKDGDILIDTDTIAGGKIEIQNKKAVRIKGTLGNGKELKITTNLLDFYSKGKISAGLGSSEITTNKLKTVDGTEIIGYGDLDFNINDDKLDNMGRINILGNLDIYAKNGFLNRRSKTIKAGNKLTLSMDKNGVVNEANGLIMSHGEMLISSTNQDDTSNIVSNRGRISAGSNVTIEDVNKIQNTSDVTISATNIKDPGKDAMNDIKGLFKAWSVNCYSGCKIEDKIEQVLEDNKVSEKYPDIEITKIGEVYTDNGGFGERVFSYKLTAKKDTGTSNGISTPGPDGIAKIEAGYNMVLKSKESIENSDSMIVANGNMDLTSKSVINTASAGEVNYYKSAKMDIKVVYLSAMSAIMNPAVLSPIDYYTDNILSDSGGVIAGGRMNIKANYVGSGKKEELSNDTGIAPPPEEAELALDVEDITKPADGIKEPTIDEKKIIELQVEEKEEEINDKKDETEEEKEEVKPATLSDEKVKEIMEELKKKDIIIHIPEGTGELFVLNPDFLDVEEKNGKTPETENKDNAPDLEDDRNETESTPEVKMRTLIITNDEFIDPNQYFGADYLVEKLGIDVEDDWRLLGDSYYDTKLVMDYIHSNLGVTFVGEDIYNSVDQMKYFLDNAAEEAKNNKLVVGEELTDEQIANLKTDIVWYVEKEVDGYVVLIPKLYLCSTTVASQTYTKLGGTVNSGAYFSAGQINIAAGLVELKGGDIFSQTNINIDAIKLQNESLYGHMNKMTAGGNIIIEVKEDINNIGVGYEAAGLVSLKSLEGDINNTILGNKIGIKTEEYEKEKVKRDETGEAILEKITYEEELDKEAMKEAMKNTAMGKGEYPTEKITKTVEKREKVYQRKDEEGNVTIYRKNSDGSEEVLEKRYVDPDKETEVFGEKGKYELATEKETFTRDLNVYDNIKYQTSIIGGTGVSLDGKNINNEASIIAGNQILMKATDNINITSAVERMNIEDDFGNRTSKTEYNTNYGSMINAVDKATFIAGKDLDVIGSYIKGANGVYMQAENVNILATRDSVKMDYKEDLSTLFSKNVTTLDSYEESANKSFIDSNGEIQIFAKNDVNILGSFVGSIDSLIEQEKAYEEEEKRREARGDKEESEEDKEIRKKEQENIAVLRPDIIISAGRDVTIGTVLEKSDITMESHKMGFLDMSDNKDLVAMAKKTARAGGRTNAGLQNDVDSHLESGYKNGTYVDEKKYNSANVQGGFVIENIKSEIHANIHENSDILGNDIKIYGGRDANFQSANINSVGDIKIFAGDNVSITTAKDTYTEKTDSTVFSIGAKAGAYSDLVGIFGSMAKSAKNDGTGAEKAGFGALETGGYVSKIITGGDLVNLNTTIGINYAESHKDNKEITDVMGGINAGGNIIIAADNGGIGIQGTDITGNDISLMTKTGDINIKRGEATSVRDEYGFDFSVGLTVDAGVSMTDAAAGASLELSGGRTKVDGYSNTGLGGDIVARNNLNIISGGNVKLDGVSFNAGNDFNGVIKGDLDVITKKDIDKLDTDNFRLDLSMGAALNTKGGPIPMPTANIGVTYGEEHGDKDWVEKQAGITSKNEFNLSVAGKTTLIAGIIGSLTDGKTNFSTGELEVQDLLSNDSLDGGYGGIGLSLDKHSNIGFDVKGGRIDSFDKEKINRATIGTGNITIGGLNFDSLDGVNRDFSNVETMTKDVSAIGFDFDYTFGNTDLPGTSKKKKNGDTPSKKTGEDIPDGRDNAPDGNYDGDRFVIPRPKIVADGGDGTPVRPRFDMDDEKFIIPRPKIIDDKGTQTDFPDDPDTSPQIEDMGNPVPDGKRFIPNVSLGKATIEILNNTKVIDSIIKVDKLDTQIATSELAIDAQRIEGTTELRKKIIEEKVPTNYIAYSVGGDNIIIGGRPIKIDNSTREFKKPVIPGSKIMDNTPIIRDVQSEIKISIDDYRNNRVDQNIDFKTPDKIETPKYMPYSVGGDTVIIGGKTIKIESSTNDFKKQVIPGSKVIDISTPITRDIQSDIRESIENNNRYDSDRINTSEQDFWNKVNNSVLPKNPAYSVGDTVMINGKIIKPIDSNINQNDRSNTSEQDFWNNVSNNIVPKSLVYSVGDTVMVDGKIIKPVDSNIDNNDRTNASEQDFWNKTIENVQSKNSAYSKSDTVMVNGKIIKPISTMEFKQQIEYGSHIIKENDSILPVNSLSNFDDLSDTSSISDFDETADFLEETKDTKESNLLEDEFYLNNKSTYEDFQKERYQLIDGDPDMKTSIDNLSLSDKVAYLEERVKNGEKYVDESSFTTEQINDLSTEKIKEYSRVYEDMLDKIIDSSENLPFQRDEVIESFNRNIDNEFKVIDESENMSFDEKTLKKIEVVKIELERIERNDQISLPLSLAHMSRENRVPGEVNGRADNLRFIEKVAENYFGIDNKLENSKELQNISIEDKENVLKEQTAKNIKKLQEMKKTDKEDSLVKEINNYMKHFNLVDTDNIKRHDDETSLQFLGLDKYGENLLGLIASEPQAPYYNRLVTGEIISKMMEKNLKLFKDMKKDYRDIKNPQRKEKIREISKAVADEYQRFAEEKLGIIPKEVIPDVEMKDMPGMQGIYTEFKVAYDKSWLNKNRKSVDEITVTTLHELTHYINHKLLVDSNEMFENYKYNISLIPESDHFKTNLDRMSEIKMTLDESKELKKETIKEYIGDGTNYIKDKNIEKAKEEILYTEMVFEQLNKMELYRKIRPEVNTGLYLEDMNGMNGIFNSLYKSDFDEYQAYSNENVVRDKIMVVNNLIKEDKKVELAKQMGLTQDIIPDVNINTDTRYREEEENVTYNDNVQSLIENNMGQINFIREEDRNIMYKKGKNKKESETKYNNKNREVDTLSLSEATEKNINRLLSLELKNIIEGVEKDTNLNELDKSIKIKELAIIEETFQNNLEKFRVDKNLETAEELGKSFNEIKEKFGIDMNEEFKKYDEMRDQREVLKSGILEISFPITNVDVLAVLPDLEYSNQDKRYYSEIRKEAIDAANEFSINKYGIEARELRIAERNRLTKKVGESLIKSLEKNSLDRPENIKRVKILDGLLSTSQQSAYFNRLVIGEIVGNSLNDLKKDIIKYSSKYNTKNVRDIKEYSEVLSQNISQNYIKTIKEKTGILMEVEVPIIKMLDKGTSEDEAGNYDPRTNEIVLIESNLPASFKELNETIYHELTHYINNQLIENTNKFDKRREEVNKEIAGEMEKYNSLIKKDSGTENKEITIAYLREKSSSKNRINELNRQKDYMEMIRNEINILNLEINTTKSVEEVTNRWDDSKDPRKRITALNFYSSNPDEFQAFNVQSLIGDRIDVIVANKDGSGFEKRKYNRSVNDDDILRAREDRGVETAKKIDKIKKSFRKTKKSDVNLEEKQVQSEINRTIKELNEDSNLNDLDRSNRINELQAMGEVFQNNFKDFQTNQSLLNAYKLGESINQVQEKLDIDVNELMKISEDLIANKRNDIDTKINISTPKINTSYLAVTPGVTYSNPMNMKYSEVKKESIDEASKYSMSKLNKNLSDLTIDERKDILKEITIKVEKSAEDNDFNSAENIRNIKILDGVLISSEDRLQFNRLIIGDIVSKSIESLKDEILEHAVKYNPNSRKTLQNYSEMVVKNIVETYKASIDEKIKINTRANIPEVVIKSEPNMKNVNGYYEMKNNRMVIIKEGIPGDFNKLNELIYHEMTHYITYELRKYQKEMAERSYQIKNEMVANADDVKAIRELENQQNYMNLINDEIEILNMGKLVKTAENLVTKNWENSDDNIKNTLALSIYSANPDEYQAFNVQALVSDKIDIIVKTENKNNFIKKDYKRSEDIQRKDMKMAKPSEIVRRERINEQDFDDNEIMLMKVDGNKDIENFQEIINISRPNMDGLTAVDLGRVREGKSLMSSIDSLEKSLNIYSGNLDTLEANETLKNMSWDERRKELIELKNDIEDEKNKQNIDLLSYDEQVEFNEIMAGFLASEQQAPYFNRLVIGDIMSKSINKQQDLLTDLRKNFLVMSEESKKSKTEKLIKAIDEEYMVFAVEKLGIMSEYTAPLFIVEDLDENLAGQYSGYELTLNRKDFMNPYIEPDEMLKTIFHELTHYINHKLLVDSASMMNNYEKNAVIYRQDLISKMNILNNESRIGLTSDGIKIDKDENGKKTAVIIKELEILDLQLSKMKDIENRIRESDDSRRLADSNPKHYESRLRYKDLYKNLAEKKETLSENKSSEKAENELKYIETVFNQLDRIYMADLFQEDVMEHFALGDEEQVRKYEKYYVANYDEYQGFHIEKLIRDKFEQLDFLREQVKREKE